MICTNCNHTLPDDSKFCQFCGTKLNLPAADPIEPVIAPTVPAEEPKPFAPPVVPTAPEAVEVVAPPPASEPVAEVPVSDPVIEEPAPESAPTDPINTQVPPTNFVPNAPVPPVQPTVKNGKHCVQCGALLSGKTCTQCGKKVSGSAKFLIPIIALSVLFFAVTILYIVQLSSTQGLKNDYDALVDSTQTTISQLESEVSSLELEVSTKQTTIDKLEREADEMEYELQETRPLVEFVDKHVVFIEDDGSNLYHKFDCYRFTGESFWAYNSEAAIGKGYNACPDCH